MMYKTFHVFIIYLVLYWVSLMAQMVKHLLATRKT